MKFALIRSALAAATATGTVCACGGAASSPQSLAIRPTAHVRFLEAAPSLEASVGGVPTPLGSAYLAVNGATAASQFPFAYLTPYVEANAGVNSISVLDSTGYHVGPLQTASLSAGNTYTIAVVGAYPSYKTVTFAEPATSDAARLSVYEASPSYPHVDFGRFRASTGSGYVKLGSAAYANVVTVVLGKSVSNFGAYVGANTKPFTHGSVTPAAVNPFDAKNVLPFDADGRLSLFVVDPASTSHDPTVIGNLDR